MTPYNKETIAEVISELEKLPNPNLATVIEQHIQALEENLCMRQIEIDSLREKLSVAIFALITAYDFIERVRARVSLIEPYYSLSGKAKLSVEEALSKIRGDAQPAQEKDDLKWKPY